MAPYARTTVAPGPGRTDVPRVPPNEGGKRMPEETVRSVVGTLCQQAEDFVDSDLTPWRVKANKYYRGDPLGNEEEGRSQIVMTTVRDTVLKILPSQMRTFFGAERAVEFRPFRSDLVDAAEQQSQYISHLWATTPNALLNVMGSLKDGLKNRLGFVKWWWEHKPQTATYQYTGITVEELELLKGEEGVQYTILDTRMGPPIPAPQIPGMPPAPPQQQVLYDCSVTRTTQQGRPQWCAVPPEEIIFNRDARDREDATIIAHRRDMTVGQLVDMGFDYDQMLEYVSAWTWATGSDEARSRNPSAFNASDRETADPTSWHVPFYEAYVKIDEDGDHHPEIRKYYLVGNYELVKDPDGDPDNKLFGESVDEIPIAWWCPDPEPHSVNGGSVSDQTMDLQRVDTALLRSNLDSLGLSIHPRMAYQEGLANPADVMNTEIGAVLRCYAPPDQAVKEFAHTYVGKDAFPLMQHMKEIREQRTGEYGGSTELNADALQSSTREGVTATLDNAQARKELYARLYAEGIMVPLFRGFYRLTVLHQDYISEFFDQGQWQQVDPRVWQAECEVEVKLWLGGGLPEKRLLVLGGIVQKQETILDKMGPGNPIVDLAQYSDALNLLVRAGGRPDSERFFKRVPQTQAAQMSMAAAQAPPQKDPATMQAEAAISQRNAELEISKGRLQLDVAKFQFEKQLQEEKLRQEMILQSRELELKYSSKIDEMQIDQAVRGRREALAAMSRVRDTETGAALDLHKAGVDAETDRQKALLDAETKRQNAETDAAAKVAAAHIQAQAAKKTNGDTE